MHHGEYRVAVRHKVWLDAGGRFAVGDGGTDLLRGIEATGSVRAAAQTIGWSYRHALAYVDNAERALGYVLVERSRGGQDRGGAQLSPSGQDFVRRYARFRRATQAAVLELYRAAFADAGAAAGRAQRTPLRLGVDLQPRRRRGRPRTARDGPP